MDAFVKKAIGFSSPNDEKILREFLKDEAKNIDKMKEKDLVNVLSNLSPKDHEITYTRLLFALSKCSNANLNVFANFTNKLFTQGTLLEEKFEVYFIGRKFAEACIMNVPMAGIRPLRAAIDRISRKDPNLLTPLHPRLLLLCILSKHYDIAQRLIETDKYAVEPQKRFGMKIKDYLEYYYYGGVVCCVNKRYKKALQCFFTVLTAPTDGNISRIQADAYRKYVLSSLIEKGEVSIPAKQQLTVGVLQKCRENAGQSYSKLNQAYKEPVEALKRKIFESKSVYESDDNWGLAKQVLRAKKMENVKQLRKTYITLSFADVAKFGDLSGVDEAKEFISEMIENQEINASINTEDKMVTFHDEEVPSDAEMTARIQAQIHEAFALSKKLKEVDEKIRAAPAFIKMTMGSTVRKDVVYTTGGQQENLKKKEQDDLREAIEKSKLER
mmetsp:Transcript_17211/g.42215  ORF Transcript_17211/g.42215 Transcript_17211/m.42215 type:complete len:442 (-) Transcript_17211:162-1487(-)|eukprot:CAMPEP_0114523102 /NCGR_PEP_ID=MMETSP0109-20121206/21108_1 /TAXON_ID=29199 /ORGANISM="Chlorarachnion reptans, Strain CCCM449" /LENGTH=441 /DNA_ID=CAMNT_0001704387 /DNA_START=186 /DNA_END=1511 /DNA_ORIENTATION=-